MCGFCGIVGPARAASPEAIGAMTDALAHRGPDDAGTHVERFAVRDAEWVLALGHRRLSILDLSPLGHQPMHSADGARVVAYNGEVYNFREIRAELAALGHRFRSDCDTEVLLEAWRAWGVACFDKLIGMFAFALWDRPARRLVLVRDRLGIKPLYWRCDGGVLTFGSELHALRAHPAFRPAISRGALGRYLRGGYTAGEETIYEDVRRLLPGSYLVWQDGAVSTHAWWRLTDPAETAPPPTFDAAVDALDALLGDAVERRMIADVPLGAFLSGGVDSSVVVALMRERSRAPVRTFSIGFREPEWDEAPHARAVAKHLGTDHTELYVSRDEAVAVAHELPSLYDEPFADASAIPTTLLSRLTRQHVTVSLSGDGGDELFGGYDRYAKLRRLAPLLALPLPLRRALAAASRGLPLGALRNGLAHLRAPDAAALAERMGAHFDDADLAAALGADAARPPPLYLDTYRAAPARDPVRRAMFADARVYMADDILAKVDRASMSVALEARVPILDHRVVRFAFSLPDALLAHGGKTKAPLRAVLYRRVPPALIERPKHGFGIPIHVLLARELAAWSARHLAPARIREDGLFDAAGVARLVAAAERPEPVATTRLWFLLCFQRWYARVHRGEEDA
ncbi:MAG: asparagine synthase (glutamine-hydrolyzing) [Proteobacteria bacterium]|nr:MAG: asparagine synthase (glutamine-hydrolyzing) [Pseudomonadota bacterium]